MENHSCDHSLPRCWPPINRGSTRGSKAAVRHAAGTIDEQHLLVRRITRPVIQRGRGAGTRQRPKTKIQRLGELLPSIPRPTLRPPHFTTGCRADPTGGLDKETASAEFKAWWAAFPPEDVTILSDGSERLVSEEKYVGYGYAIY